MARLEGRALEFAYGARAEPVLHGVDVAVESGELVGLVGPNGAGKSTLIRLLAGLLQPRRGAVQLDGRALETYRAAERARRIAYVPQDSSLAFPFTVAEVILSGRYAYGGLSMFETAEDRAVLERVLAWTDLAPLADRPFPELSGGERQRTVLAAALAQEPEVLLLDEPTSSLDVNHADVLLELLDRLRCEQGLSVVLALHDLSLAAAWCPRLLLLLDGGIAAEGAPAEVLSADRLATVYGEAVRRLDLDGRIVVAPRGRRPDA